MNAVSLLRIVFVRKFNSQQGFLTIAQNTSEVDYLNLAYLQAENIKKTQKENQYAVIVDQPTMDKITDRHRKVFDYVILLPKDYSINDHWKLQNEWQVFNLTPFKETIKLESDLLFTQDIGHWFPALRLREICFSTHCKNYQGKVIRQSPYRELFAVNALPDIYNGMFYFRYSQTAASFFELARDIYLNWAVIKDQLIRCDSSPTTDVVFALAAKLIGIEKTTIPTLDFFNFVHMKPKLQGWSEGQPWTDYVNIEYDNNIIRINNVNQYSPVHYYEKKFNDN